MADKGIIFSAPMVRALLDGRKTQTRRLIKVTTKDMAPGQILHFEGPAIGGTAYRFAPPYAPGDRLYVREAWSHTGQGVWDIAAARMMGRGGVIYSADGKVPGAKYWPSIHMPREFSRLWLSVTDVRVQRVQEISEADVAAEGTPCHVCGGRFPSEYDCHCFHRQPARIDFGTLWNSLHTKPGERWEDNPFVVALSFAVHHAAGCARWTA